jgi:hypothetical protein
MMSYGRAVLPKTEILNSPIWPKPIDFARWLVAHRDDRWGVFPHPDRPGAVRWVDPIGAFMREKMGADGAYMMPEWAARLQDYLVHHLPKLPDGRTFGADYVARFLMEVAPSTWRYVGGLVGKHTPEPDRDVPQGLIPPGVAGLAVPEK